MRARPAAHAQRSAMPVPSGWRLATSRKKQSATHFSSKNQTQGANKFRVSAHPTCAARGRAAPSQWRTHKSGVDGELHANQQWEALNGWAGRKTIPKLWSSNLSEPPWTDVCLKSPCKVSERHPLGRGFRKWWCVRNEQLKGVKGAWQWGMMGEEGGPWRSPWEEFFSGGTRG